MDKKVNKFIDNKLHDLAVKLCEGEVISFNTHSIKAKDFFDEDLPCYDCDMDSICDVQMSNLCAECDAYHRHNHILVLCENAQQ